jgi:hypothetical protein
MSSLLKSAWILPTHNATEPGRKLLKECETVARQLDDEFTAALTTQQRAALSRALGILAADAGLP